jgi:hypothetical protein
MIINLEWLTLVTIFRRYIPFRGIYVKIKNKYILYNYELKDLSIN